MKCIKIYLLVFITTIFFFQSSNAQVNVNKDPRIDWLRNVQINLNKISSPYTAKYALLVAYTKQREEALDAKRILYNNFPNEKVSLDYNPPYYRVKVGNYMSLDEAHDFKYKLQPFFSKEITVLTTTPQKLKIEDPTN